MERGFTTHYWDNWKASKAWDSQKKTDGIGKNSENHGASCVGGPSVPGMLADVVERVVPCPDLQCKVARAGARYLLLDSYCPRWTIMPISAWTTTRRRKKKRTETIMDPGSERGQRDGRLCGAKRAFLLNLVSPRRQRQGWLAKLGLGAHCGALP